MSRVIIASEYVDESQNSTGYFWSRIVNCLKLDGCDVAVLRPRSRNKYDSFEGNAGLVKRFFKQLCVSFDLSCQIYQAIKKDAVIFTGTNPALLLCFMPLLKRLLNIRWVLLVHDVFPDNLVAAGVIKRSNLVYKFAEYYFSWVYSSSDRLICIGRDMQALLQKKTKNKTETFFVPNWASGDDVYPLARNELDLFNENKLENHVVFQFFGNIGRVQGVENLLAAISLVTAKNAAFVFIGGGALVPAVVQFIACNPTKEVKFLGPMSLDQKNRGLAFCDVALVSLEAGMLGLGVPSKSYFSLAAGKPILAAVDAESEVGLMLNEFPVGWRCDPGAPAQLAKLIDRICQSPLLIKEKTPREVFLNNYEEKIVVKKIIAVLMGSECACKILN